MPTSTNYKDLQNQLGDEGHNPLPSGSVIALVAATKKALQPFRSVKNSTEPTDISSSSWVVLIEKTVEFDGSSVRGNWELGSLYIRLYCLILDDASYGNRAASHISSKPDWRAGWDAASYSLELSRPKRFALLLQCLYVARWYFLCIVFVSGHFLARYREGASREVTSLVVLIDVTVELDSCVEPGFGAVGSRFIRFCCSILENASYGSTAAITIIAYLFSGCFVFAVFPGVNSYRIYSCERTASTLVAALVSTAGCAAGLVLEDLGVNTYSIVS
jgi:hypothetical protein